MIEFAPRLAVMLFLSGALLFYTAIVVPAQIFLWDYSDPCVVFPTLYFDVVVDIFFMVPTPSEVLFCPVWRLLCQPLCARIHAVTSTRYRP